MNINGKYTQASKIFKGRNKKESKIKIDYTFVQKIDKLNNNIDKILNNYVR